VVCREDDLQHCLAVLSGFQRLFEALDHFRKVLVLLRETEGILTPP